MHIRSPRLSRRAFAVVALAGAGIGAGTLGLGWVQRRRRAADAVPLTVRPGHPGELRLGVMLRIAADGTVNIVSSQAELGQGVQTALPMAVAEELDAAWSRVHVMQADLDPAFGNQFTGASLSIPQNLAACRRLGATARAMLVAAASHRWGVPASQCRTIDGEVRHEASGRSLPYGALAGAAAALPVPDNVALKSPDAFRLLGTRVTGVDVPAIVSGAPIFGSDFTLPGLVHAMIERCPVPGGLLLEANLAEVKALPGVVDAFALDGAGGPYGLRPGVAVIARSTWAAMRARAALKLRWQLPDAAGQDAASWSIAAQALDARPGHPGAMVLRRDGDVEASIAKAARRLQAQYAYPFVAHAAMEPLNCTAHHANGTLDLWTASQNPAAAHAAVAATLGIAPTAVRLHGLRCGGAFGRRLGHDWIVEAAAVAMRVDAPVKLTWTREDDFAHDHHRPAAFHFLRAGLDAAGRITAWHDHVVGFSHDGERPGPGGRIDAEEFPARWVEPCLIELSHLRSPVPTGMWRAPVANGVAWVVQSFIDELAHAAGKDPLAFRLALLGTSDRVRSGGLLSRAPGYRVDRMRAVLKAVAERGDWGRLLPRGQGQGLAFHHCHGGYAAQLVEVTVTPAGRLTVDRVVCVCDVGELIVNPSGAEAQVEGSILDALSAAWWQEAAFSEARVQHRNFDTYPVLRMADTPQQIEVHFLRSPVPNDRPGRAGAATTRASTVQCDFPSVRPPHSPAADLVVPPGVGVNKFQKRGMPPPD